MRLASAICTVLLVGCGPDSAEAPCLEWRWHNREPFVEGDLEHWGWKHYPVLGADGTIRHWVWPNTIVVHDAEGAPREWLEVQIPEGETIARWPLRWARDGSVWVTTEEDSDTGIVERLRRIDRHGASFVEVVLEPPDLSATEERDPAAERYPLAPFTLADGGMFGARTVDDTPDIFYSGLRSIGEHREPDGSLVWRVDFPEHSSVFLVAEQPHAWWIDLRNAELHGASSHRLAQLDPSTGALRWRDEWEISDYMDYDVVYLPAPDGGLVGLKTRQETDDDYDVDYFSWTWHTRATVWRLGPHGEELWRWSKRIDVASRGGATILANGRIVAAYVGPDHRRGSGELELTVLTHDPDTGEVVCTDRFKLFDDRFEESPYWLWHGTEGIGTPAGLHLRGFARNTEEDLARWSGWLAPIER